MNMCFNSCSSEAMLQNQIDILWMCVVLLTRYLLCFLWILLVGVQFLGVSSEQDSVRSWRIHYESYWMRDLEVFEKSIVMKKTLRLYRDLTPGEKCPDVQYWRRHTSMKELKLYHTCLNCQTENKTSVALNDYMIIFKIVIYLERVNTYDTYETFLQQNPNRTL